MREGIDEPQPIASLPGVVQHTRESLRKEVSELAALGVPAVILFGVPARKDHEGSEAWNPDGIVQLALRDLRDELGDQVVVMADCCLDEYTDHGHCGVLTAAGEVDNDATIELYARAAVAQADAGAHVVAPSGMMDGQVGAIRQALDGAGHERRGHPRLLGQVRVGAVRAVPRCGRRARSSAGAIARATSRTRATLGRRSSRSSADLAQGADIVMVKPALAYLDVIAEVRARVDVPVAAYHVSGEYAMIKAAAEPTAGSTARPSPSST